VSLATLTPWIVFLAVVGVLLAIDFGVAGRRDGAMTTRNALAWSVVWIGAGLSFSLVV
jgi:tellurite resistance protein TerC